MAETIQRKRDFCVVVHEADNSLSRQSTVLAYLGYI